LAPVNPGVIVPESETVRSKRPRGTLETGSAPRFLPDPPVEIDVPAKTDVNLLPA